MAPLPRSTPEAQGIPSAALLAFLDAVEERTPEVHSLMVLRHGRVVAEGWWSPYQREQPHMLFSLSKSFTATAAGLAISEGRLSLDDPVLGFFPDEAPATVSENLAALRVRHLLSMSTGHVQDTTRALREDENWARAFLAQPIERAPGTHFVYNSGASYMVSAIVGKVTGTTVQEYLRPRLFAPLGIASDVPWENSPQGINTGGWGLSLRTEDIARFGQLYLQKGVWDGKRVLPEEWIEQATARQVSNGDDPNSDWSQGYGYQFWRSRHDSYRGDGAFGQFCVVLPAQEAVVAITAGVSDLRGLLGQVWEHLLPAFQPALLPEDPAAEQSLRSRLAHLALRPPEGRPGSPRAATMSNRTYHFDPNEQKIEAITLELGEGGDILQIRDAHGEHRIAVGAGGVWSRRTTAFDSGKPRAVAASGAWTGEDVYTVKICFTETPFGSTITCRFLEDRVLFHYRANVSFGPVERPELLSRPL